MNLFASDQVTKGSGVVWRKADVLVMSMNGKKVIRIDALDAPWMG